MMLDSTWSRLIERLNHQGILFEAGLTDAEIARIEDPFGFRFPPHLRAFLQTALPVGDGFPDWRGEPDPSIRERLALPLDELLPCVEDGFWWPEWGPRPRAMEDARVVVRRLVAIAPVLIPIYRHRMIPDRPHEPGNPVFSVHQTDYIYYGRDLHDYLNREFLSADEPAWSIPDSARRIEFWGEAINWSGV